MHVLTNLRSSHRNATLARVTEALSSALHQLALYPLHPMTKMQPTNM
jgi:hypothetical protein